MKMVFNILFLLIFIMPSEGQNENVFAVASAKAKQAGEVQISNTSSFHAFRFINASKLKRIPAVVRDLSVALNESRLSEQFLSGDKKISVYMYDVHCTSFEISAAVQYFPGDTMYRLKLNRLNQHATDLSLAATLIHETMHCILLDIYQRAQRGEQKAINNIRRFKLGKDDSTYNAYDDFFYLMNSGNDGQHELISRLFYHKMVWLLERFAEIHKRTFLLNKKTAERMMWTGLQNTNAFKQLNDEDKRMIVTTILEGKRIVNETE